MSSESAVLAPSVRRPWWRRAAPVAGLLLLSPYCAEYLVGYQGVLTSPVDLLAAVVFVLPIYGAPAVLIRDLTRRTGRGWPTLLLLATAVGLIQAGWIDQSLFNHRDFADGPLPTLLPGLDVDASQLLTFLVGHVIWSFGAPVAVIESCVPERAGRPWLGWKGTAVLAVVYVAGAVFFTYQLVVVPGFHARPGQLVAVGVAVAAAVGAAFALPRRTARTTGTVPPPWGVGLVALALLAAFVTLNDQWAWRGVAVALAALTLLGVLLVRWSRRSGWGRRHRLAVAAAALLLYAGLAFAVNPQHTPQPVLYASRGAALLGVVVLLYVAARRTVRARPAG
ncbi:hypothetical protein [Streptomyces catenulae]|uniref:DUF998 domain-containing protein n=1 Tax=Streptomyces catenulae TaxID=66875 RepID=A0ABV2YYQ9_9ACTN|nr:hypothetical protein [Streptomyces catenulae]